MRLPGHKGWELFQQEVDACQYSAAGSGHFATGRAAARASSALRSCHAVGTGLPAVSALSALARGVLHAGDLHSAQQAALAHPLSRSCSPCGSPRLFVADPAASGTLPGVSGCCFCRRTPRPPRCGHPAADTPAARGPPGRGAVRGCAGEAAAGSAARGLLTGGGRGWDSPPDCSNAAAAGPCWRRAPPRRGVRKLSGVSVPPECAHLCL